MDDNHKDSLETLLADAHSQQVPADLRATVLSQVNYQLKSSRWERRMVKATLLLLTFGLALNAKVGWEGREMQVADYASRTTPEQLIEVGVSVAETTNTKMGIEFASHLAALGGTSLSKVQASNIEKAIQARTNSKKAG